MKSNSLLLAAACAGLLSASLSSSANANAAPAEGKCYGISNAGKNSCASASGKHSCETQSTTDNDPGDWVNMAPADCIKNGGKTVAPAAPVKN